MVGYRQTFARPKHHLVARLTSPNHCLHERILLPYYQRAILREDCNAPESAQLEVKLVQRLLSETEMGNLTWIVPQRNSTTSLYILGDRSLHAATYEVVQRPPWMLNRPSEGGWGAGARALRDPGPGPGPGRCFGMGSEGR